MGPDAKPGNQDSILSSCSLFYAGQVKVLAIGPESTRLCSVQGVQLSLKTGFPTLE